MYWSTLAIVPHGDNRTRQETDTSRDRLRGLCLLLVQAPSDGEGAAADLGFLGCANALLMSAKTFEMAQGGGGEGLRRTTTTWSDAFGGSSAEASRCHTACAAARPCAFVLVISRDGHTLESGISCPRRQWPSGGGKKTFFHSFSSCAQGRVWAYAGSYVRHAASRVTSRHGSAARGFPLAVSHRCSSTSRLRARATLAHR